MGLDSAVSFSIIQQSYTVSTATSASASKMVSFRSNATKAEVRARLPKQDEKKDNDDWVKFEVCCVACVIHSTDVLKQGIGRFNVLVENADFLGYHNLLE